MKTKTQPDDKAIELLAKVATAIKVVESRQDYWIITFDGKIAVTTEQLPLLGINKESEK